MEEQRITTVRKDGRNQEEIDREVDRQRSEFLAEAREKMGLQPLESIPKPEFEDATEEDRERVRVDSCWSEVRCKGHPCDGLQVEPTPTSPGISRGEDVYEVEDPEEEKSPEEFFDEDQDTDRELVLIDVFEKFGVLECGYRCAALRALLDKKSGRKSLILAKKLIEKDLRSYVNGLPEDWDSV